MCFHWFSLCLFITTLCIASRGSNYNVAVVEYGPNLNYSLTPDQRLALNVQNYIELIQETTNKVNQTLDLIVFPESTLMYLNSVSETAFQLPSSRDIILCNSSDKNYSSFLKDFSCAAIQYKITIIINFTEKEPCSEESPSNCTDFTFYNTDVAFDPYGIIIARYRKWNLFGELGKTKPTKLDLPVITMKNTTFGIMTCFDIQFGIPVFNLTREMGIQNIIFPLNWISELPYLTALQAQQMWAQEFDVILLAAGASVPTKGAGGSGIFLGSQGSLESDILAQHGTKVMLQSVPTDLQAYDVNTTYNINDTDESIDVLASEMDDFYMLVDPSIVDHNSIILNTSQENTSTRVCHGDDINKLCCDFNISLSINQNLSSQTGKTYTYHLVAFNGIRTYSQLYYGGVETCGLIACLNTSLASCGKRFQNYSEIIWPLKFNSINITGFFIPSDQRIQFASTLISSIRPLPLHTVSWQKEVDNSTVIRKLILKEPQSRLLAFGIFGRDFDRDWDPIRNNTHKNLSNKIDITSISLIFPLLSMLYIVKFTELIN